MLERIYIFCAGYKIYVFDKDKQIIYFKEKEYWESYTTYDAEDLIEYMNQKLNYNQFIETNINIYIEEPEHYDWFFNNRKAFQKSKGMNLLPIDTRLLKEVGIKKYIQQTIEPIEYSSWERCLEYQLLLSPVNMYVEELPIKQKRKYLEVENKLVEKAVDGTLVKQGEILLKYEQIVYQLFGRKRSSYFTRKALLEGKFVEFIKNINEGMYSKNQIIGVVTPQNKSREDVFKWLEISFRNIKLL